MAIMKRGILGGLKGKIGNVVGTSWKGREVLKAMPLSVANPRTSGQVNQRTKFKACSVLSSNLLATIVKPLNDPFSGNISGWNIFMHRNIQCFTYDGSYDATSLELAVGKMNETTNLTASIITQGLRVDWNDTITDKYGTPTDWVYIALVRPDNVPHIDKGYSQIAVRSTGTITIPSSDLPEGLDTAWYCLLAFIRKDNAYASRTQHANLI